MACPPGAFAGPYFGAAPWGGAGDEVGLMDLGMAGRTPLVAGGSGNLI